jgi:hypothetical protein
MARPGFLIFRHVATVEGKGGRLPIVWDESNQYYKFRYPFVGNPNAPVNRGIDGDFVRRFSRTQFRSAMGAFDAVLTMAATHAKGDGDSVELSFAPTSTEEERKLGAV